MWARRYTTKNRNPVSRSNDIRLDDRTIPWTTQGKKIMAHARAMDPLESHLAAASINHIRTTPTREAILNLLALSPMTDEELCQAYRNMAYIGGAPHSSDSNIRTQRCHLHRESKVHVVGVTKSASGRQTRIWRTAWATNYREHTKIKSLKRLQSSQIKHSAWADNQSKTA